MPGPVKITDRCIMAKHTKNVYKKKFSKFMQKKLVLLFVAIILAFAVLIGRITYINASNGSSYTKMVLDQQQYDSRVLPFKRGDILDTNGTVLATSEKVYNLILDCKVVNSREESLISTTGYIIFGLTVWVFSGILVWKFYKRLRVVKSPQVLIG